MRAHLFVTAGVTALALAGCSLPPGSSDPLVGFGPNPPLPAPRTALIPMVGVPKVVHWAPGAGPKAPPGFTVTRYAEGLDHPRWLYVLPNGDVLVSESASEPSPADKSNRGIKGYFQKLLMKNVGSAEKSPNQIILLRDTNGDGLAETRATFAKGMIRPFGMTLTGGKLYVANDDGVVSFPYADGQVEEQGVGTKVFDLPGPPINHHWTKNVMASPDGSRLYATVGSNSNIGENGMENETGRAAIWEHVIATGQTRIFASGIRNPNGIGFEPTTGVMWTVSNERDEIGADLPPDFLTSVKDGAFYGWPYSYYGQNGSWNRKPLNGYRVVFVPFAGGRPQMPAQVFLTGFLDADNQIQGRPVGVAVDRTGALLVADDVGGIVWRVSPTSRVATP